MGRRPAPAGAADWRARARSPTSAPRRSATTSPMTARCPATRSTRIATARGLSNALIEVRQDLIGDTRARRRPGPTGWRGMIVPLIVAATRAIRRTGAAARSRRGPGSPVPAPRLTRRAPRGHGLRRKPISRKCSSHGTRNDQGRPSSAARIRSTPRICAPSSSASSGSKRKRRRSPTTSRTSTPRPRATASTSRSSARSSRSANRIATSAARRKRFSISISPRSAWPDTAGKSDERTPWSRALSPASRARRRRLRGRRRRRRSFRRALPPLSDRERVSRRRRRRTGDICRSPRRCSTASRASASCTTTSAAISTPPAWRAFPSCARSPRRCSRRASSRADRTTRSPRRSTTRSCGSNMRRTSTASGSSRTPISA